MIAVTLRRPWLIADLGQPMQCLSWAPVHGGFHMAQRVLWREVRNADLTPEFDAIAWLEAEMRERSEADAIGLLTSRDIGRHRHEVAASEGAEAACLATVGLSNAERVGHRRGAAEIGTINILVSVNAPLTQPALIEALAIAAQARTAAIMDHGPDLPTGRATGTGTDCIVMAAPPGDTAYAGLHTAIGEVIGRAVYTCIAAGTVEWMESEGRE